jgi:hypothetical protein
MAALNQQETTALREAEGVIEGVLRNGYDPNDPEHKMRGLHLKRAKDKIDTIVQMKGYYPK